MPVYLSRSECRPGSRSDPSDPRSYWHVVTYDVTNPNKWVEVEDIPTEQPNPPAPAVFESPNIIEILRVSKKEAKKLVFAKKGKKGKKRKGGAKP